MSIVYYDLLLWLWLSDWLVCFILVLDSIQVLLKETTYSPKVSICLLKEVDWNARLWLFADFDFTSTGGNGVQRQLEVPQNRKTLLPVRVRPSDFTQPWDSLGSEANIVQSLSVLRLKHAPRDKIKELCDTQDRAAAAIQGGDDYDAVKSGRHTVKKAILLEHLHVACLSMSLWRGGLWGLRLKNL